MSLTAVASVLTAHNIPHLVVASDIPYPADFTRRHYENLLRKPWFHGSDSPDIKEFKGQAFFSVADIAATYGYDGHLYKVQVSSSRPYVLVENPARQSHTADGDALKGTDLALRDFLRTELFRGCADDVIDGFDEKYKHHGPDVPTRLFGVSSQGEEWETIAANMKRLGFDSLLYRDEGYSRQAEGDACFVPECIGHVEILGKEEITGDKVPEEFV